MGHESYNMSHVTINFRNQIVHQQASILSTMAYYALQRKPISLSKRRIKVFIITIVIFYRYILATFRQKLKLNQRCVGFYGSWVYLLNGTDVETIQVPQTGAMYHYMEEENYEAAYEIACIGVTSSDWSYLGNKTLRKLKLDLAKLAFSQTKDYR